MRCGRCWGRDLFGFRFFLGTFNVRVIGSAVERSGSQGVGVFYVRCFYGFRGGFHDERGCVNAILL